MCLGNHFSIQDLELSEEEQLLIINRLHSVLRPLMLRRTKAEVAGELPDKTERVLRCSLSPWQAALYRSITSSRNIGDARGRTVSLSNLTMHLRKACLAHSAPCPGLFCAFQSWRCMLCVESGPNNTVKCRLGYLGAVIMHSTRMRCTRSPPLVVEEAPFAGNTSGEASMNHSPRK